MPIPLKPKTKITAHQCKWRAESLNQKGRVVTGSLLAGWLDPFAKGTAEGTVDAKMFS
jgi:hypothetical protein